jgi:hypothetical protein
MLSEKLAESLIAGGLRGEEIDTCNHSTNMRFAEWTVEALVNFAASSILMITKGWREKNNGYLIRSFGKTL